MAQEPHEIIGPGPSSPVMRQATPNAFRKSIENRLPRNINFLWPILALAAAAVGWATFGDDLMRLADSKPQADGKADRLYAAPPTGGFDLTFPPEPKVAQAPPPPSPPPPPPPPEPVPPSSFAEQKPEPETDTTPPPEPDDGMIENSFQDQPKNPYGPVSKKVAMMGEGLKADIGIDATTRDRWQGCAIEPGYVVPVNLIHAVNSEIPGPAVFELREPYYSPVDPSEPLLPVGTRFIGHYRSEKGGAGDKLGDTRLSFKITVATIPDGRAMRRLKLDEARIAVLSGNGMVGLGGEVDQKLLPLLGYATIAALIDSATRTTTDEESLSGRVRGSAADSYGDVGREVVERTIDVAPKIRIMQGPAQLLFSDPVRVGRCR